ncbi:MAG: hypothetical protein NZM38_00600 [Cytophagales bacterium]|nr:hypothetical protein [Cytophagales bacterium]MDW8383247.1 hypothetical protein [Flammeovirgaceae bacterium]
MKKLLTLLLFVKIWHLVTSCSSENAEIERLKQENAQLRQEIIDNQSFTNKIANGVNELMSLLDSLEKTENEVYVSLEGGTNYQELKTRIEHLHQKFHSSKNTLTTIETALEKARKENNELYRTIDNLKNKLAEKEKHILELQAQVEKYKEDNRKLITRVDIMKEMLQKRNEEILAKKRELTTLNSKINELKYQQLQMQIESYIIQGDAAFEIAERTQLAPRKKREAYQQAYEFYKRAYDSGRTDVLEKMKLIEQKL